MPERVRAWVEAGYLGLPRSVNVECHDLGAAVELARTLTGCEPVDIFAEGTGDTIVASMLMTHGVVASLVAGPVPGTGSARLIGSHGHTEIDLDEPAVRHYGPGGVRLIPIQPPSGAPLAARSGPASGAPSQGADGAPSDAPSGPPSDGSAGVESNGPSGAPADARSDAVTIATVEAARRSIASGRPEEVPR